MELVAHYAHRLLLLVIFQQQIQANLFSVMCQKTRVAASVSLNQMHHLASNVLILGVFRTN